MIGLSFDSICKWKVMSNDFKNYITFKPNKIGPSDCFSMEFIFSYNDLKQKDSIIVQFMIDNKVITNTTVKLFEAISEFPIEITPLIGNFNSNFNLTMNSVDLTPLILKCDYYFENIAKNYINKTISYKDSFTNNFNSTILKDNLTKSENNYDWYHDCTLCDKENQCISKLFKILLNNSNDDDNKTIHHENINNTSNTTSNSTNNNTSNTTSNSTNNNTSNTTSNSTNNNTSNTTTKIEIINNTINDALNKLENFTTCNNTNCLNENIKIMTNITNSLNEVINCSSSTPFSTGSQVDSVIINSSINALFSLTEKKKYINNDSANSIFNITNCIINSSSIAMDLNTNNSNIQNDKMISNISSNVLSIGKNLNFSAGVNYSTSASFQTDSVVINNQTLLVYK